MILAFRGKQCGFPKLHFSGILARCVGLGWSLVEESKKKLFLCSFTQSQWLLLTSKFARINFEEHDTIVQGLEESSDGTQSLAFLGSENSIALRMAEFW